MVGKLNRGGSFLKIQVPPASHEWKTYTEGYLAQSRGLAFASNPWAGRMPASGNWDQGWTDANNGIQNPMLNEKPHAPMRSAAVQEGKRK